MPDMRQLAEVVSQDYCAFTAVLVGTNIACETRRGTAAQKRAGSPSTARNERRKDLAALPQNRLLAALFFCQQPNSESLASTR